MTDIVSQSRQRLADEITTERNSVQDVYQIGPVRFLLSEVALIEKDLNTNIKVVLKGGFLIDIIYDAKYDQAYHSLISTWMKFLKFYPSK